MEVEQDLFPFTKPVLSKFPYFVILSSEKFSHMTEVEDHCEWLDKTLNTKWGERYLYRRRISFGVKQIVWHFTKEEDLMLFALRCL
jgi:hypothetical protein